MYDEYDPISLFECNSCFRVNTQTFWEPTLKIGLLKMYPYFKLLIFGYISRFLTKFSILLRFFWALNMNPPLFFVLDLRNMVKKWFTKRYLIQGKTPVFGVLTPCGVPSRGQNQKIPSDSSSPCRKTSQNKKSAKLENFLEILKKKFSNLADFLFGGVFRLILQKHELRLKRLIGSYSSYILAYYWKKFHRKRAKNADFRYIFRAATTKFKKVML